MSVSGIGRLRLCYSGGGYFRLLTRRMIEAGIRSEGAQGRPTVIYLHPSDFAPDCPRIRMPLARGFKSHCRAGTTEGKLRRLLGQYHFAPCEEVLDGLGLLQRAAA